MKRSGIALVLLLGLFALPALADNVTLTGAGPNSGGVDVYPYTLTDSGLAGGASISVICDSFLNTVSLGETWTANTVGFNAAGQVVGGAGIYSTNVLSNAKYDEALGLYYDLLNHVGAANAAGTNYAIWGLFDPALVSSTAYTSTDAATLISGYSTPAGINYTSFDLIVPVAGSQSVNGTAQEYIYQDVVTATPEPGSLVLFGSGLLGLAGFMRRKLHA